MTVLADVLSQGEIDALLSAISTGEMNADEIKKENQNKVKLYDFKKAMRFSKEQIRSLTRIHENFSRLLTTVLSSQLRTNVSIEVQSVDQVLYGEFIQSVPKMTILNVFNAYPLDGRFLMEINPHVAYSMLDRLLGGKGSSMNKVDKLTEFESRVISRMSLRMIDNFKVAWSSLVELEPELETFEVNPQFVQIVSPSETVIVVSLTVTIAESVGTVNICIPHIIMDDVLPKLTNHHLMQSSKKAKEGDKEIIEQKLNSASLLLQAELGRTQITIQQFLNLNIGDVIPLNQEADKPVTINISGNPKYKAQPGILKNHLALQITDSIEEG